MELHLYVDELHAVKCLAALARLAEEHARMVADADEMLAALTAHRVVCQRMMSRRLEWRCRVSADAFCPLVINGRVFDHTAAENTITGPAICARVRS